MCTHKRQQTSDTFPMHSAGKSHKSNISQQRRYHQDQNADAVVDHAVPGSFCLLVVGRHPSRVGQNGFLELRNEGVVGKDRPSKEQWWIAEIRQIVLPQNISAKLFQCS